MLSQKGPRGPGLQGAGTALRARLRGGGVSVSPQMWASGILKCAGPGMGASNQEGFLAQPPAPSKMPGTPKFQLVGEQGGGRLVVGSQHLGQEQRQWPLDTQISSTV